MALNNDQELVAAVSSAGDLLQIIHNYTQRVEREDAKVRFPRGLIKTANEYRALLPGYLEPNHASGCAYAFMYLDVLWWLTNRTDITLTAKEMALKSAIVNLGTIAECVLTIKFRPGFGHHTNFKVRLNSAVQLNLLSDEDRNTLSALWDNRCNVHLKELEGSEFDKYESEDVNLPRVALDRLLPSLKAWHERGYTKK